MNPELFWVAYVGILSEQQIWVVELSIERFIAELFLPNAEYGIVLQDVVLDVGKCYGFDLVRPWEVNVGDCSWVVLETFVAEVDVVPPSF